MRVCLYSFSIGGHLAGFPANTKNDFPYYFRGHHCCFWSIVGQRQKPLQNDADKCDLLSSGKSVVCSPEPLRTDSRTMLFIAGTPMLGFPAPFPCWPPRKLGGRETPDEGFPTRKQFTGLFSLPFLRFAYAKGFALCGARPEATRLWTLVNLL